MQNTGIRWVGVPEPQVQIPKQLGSDSSHYINPLPSLSHSHVFIAIWSDPLPDISQPDIFLFARSLGGGTENLSNFAIFIFVNGSD